MTSLNLSCCTARRKTALVAFLTGKFSQARFVDQCRRVHEVRVIDRTCVVIGPSRTDLSLFLCISFFFVLIALFASLCWSPSNAPPSPVNHERRNSYNKEMPSGRQWGSANWERVDSEWQHTFRNPQKQLCHRFFLESRSTATISEWRTWTILGIVWQ